MSKGNIITLIIILIISVIVAVIALLVNDNEEEKNKYKTEYGIITLVDNSDTFFSVSANLNKFYTFLYENNNEKLYNILDKNYIIENNITTNNVNTLLSHNDNNVKVVVDKIYVVSKNEMYIY